MRTTSKLAVALGLVIVVTATAASAQTRDTPPAPRRPASPAAPVRDRPPVAKTGTAVISGRVVDAVSGRGIPRARIRLSGPAMQQGPILSDADGAFGFDALPQGAFTLMVERQGYIFTQYPDRSQSLRASAQRFEVRDGQRVENLTIPMFRAGAIAGRVVDAYGEPVENASVTVLLVPKSGRPQQRGGGQTNDLGEFRVWRLPPGRYLLRVRATNNSANDSKPLPQAVPVYFPTATTIDQAQIIVLNRSESVTGLEVVLPEVTPTTVSGIVLPIDGQPVTSGSVTYRSAAAPEFGGGGGEGGTGIRPDGTFRVQLPPGDYIFEAVSQPNRGPNQVYRPETELRGSVRVAVAGESIEGVMIPIATGATASGRIIFEGKSPPPAVVPSNARPPLSNPDGPGCRPGVVTIAPDWSFKAEGLGGTCAAEPQGMFGRWTLKAVMVGDDDLTARTITFQPGESYTNVRIIVTDVRPSVEFRVSDDNGEPSREFVVIMLPADKSRWTEQIGRYVRTVALSIGPEGSPPSDVSGTASASSISLRGGSPGIAKMFPSAVGDYYAVAVDDIHPDDLTDAVLLEKLVQSGARFTVSADTPLEVPLRRVQLSRIVR